MASADNEKLFSASHKESSFQYSYGSLLKSQQDEEDGDLRTSSSSSWTAGETTSTYAPETERNNTRQDGISNLAVIVHVIKGNIGTGILAMPNAFSNSGIVLGPVGLVILGVICVHCMHMLVKTSQSLCRRLNVTSLDYAEVGEKTFSLNLALRPHKRKARIAVNTCLIITQFGGCSVYLLFIASNIKQIVEFACTTSGSKFTMSLQLYELILAVLLLLYVMIRDIKHLTPFSLMANILSIAGLVLIMYYITIDHPLNDISRLPAVTKWSSIPLFFGTAIFAFEGIGVMLPLENKMREPAAFLPLCGVLNVGMTIVCVLYFTVGFYGYIEFGSEAQGSITLNIESWIGVVVKGIFSLCIFASYGIQFYVLITILNDSFSSTRIANKVGAGRLDIILRVIFVWLTFGTAAIFNTYLGLLISLIGAFTSTALTLIFPPILDMLTQVATPQPDAAGAKSKLRTATLVKNILILIFGVSGCVIGTYTSLEQLISQLIKDYSH